MRLDKYSKGIQRCKTFITLAILFVVIKIDTCTAGGRNHTHTHTHGETHMYMHTRTHTHTHKEIQELVRLSSQIKKLLI